MAITIRGFTLPPLLEKFLHDGVWTNNRSITVPPEMLTAIRTRTIEDVTVRLYDLEGLQSDNTYFDMMDDDSFEFLKIFNAWESSKRSGKPITDSTKLDIDFAVCIASELTDEVIHLDYRVDASKPRVMIMDWDNREWRILAPDFETFAKGIGFIE